MRLQASIAIVAVLIIAFTTAGTQVTGGDRRPLLIEGKTTLYQRVLTSPGAAVSAQPAVRTARNCRR